MRCVGYVRWSREKMDEGSTEERQRENIEALAAKQGWPIDEWVTDRAVSAKDCNNLIKGNIGILMRRILADPSPTALLIDDPSRFSRGNTIKTLAYLTPLLDHGMVLGVASDQSILSVSDATALLKLFSVALVQHGAHTSNEDRVAKVRYSKKRTREHVQSVANTVASANVPEWLTCPRATHKKDYDRKIELHEVRSRILSEIFEMALTIGPIRIARKLNKLAEADARYIAWCKDGVWKSLRITDLLKDRKVLGELQMRRIVGQKPNTKRGKNYADDGPLMLEYYPQAIKPALWRKVQAARAQRTRVKSGRPSRKNVNLFAGLCRCAHCGKSMMPIPPTRFRRYDRLYCIQRSRGRCENSQTTNLFRFERAFLAGTVIGFLQQASDFAESTDAINAASAAIEQHERDLRDGENGHKNVSALLRLAETDDEQSDMRAQLAVERERVKAARAALEAARVALDIARGCDLEASARRAEFLIKDARAGADSFELGCQTARMELGEIIRTMVKQIDFDGDRVVIHPAHQAPTVQYHGVQPISVVGEVLRNRRKIFVELLPIPNGVKASQGTERVYLEGFAPKNLQQPTRVQPRVSGWNPPTFHELDGRRMSAPAWAREIGISAVALAWRLRRGWDLRRALTEPRGSHGPAAQSDDR